MNCWTAPTPAGRWVGSDTAKPASAAASAREDAGWAVPEEDHVIVPNRAALDPFGVGKPPRTWLSPRPMKAAIARRSLWLTDTGATWVGAKIGGERGRRGRARDHDPDRADDQPGAQRHPREPRDGAGAPAPAAGAVGSVLGSALQLALEPRPGHVGVGNQLRGGQQPRRAFGVVGDLARAGRCSARSRPHGR